LTGRRRSEGGPVAVRIVAGVLVLFVGREPAACFDERPAVSQVREVINERAGEDRGVVNADPVRRPLIVGKAAHRGQLVAKSQTSVRAEPERTNRPESGTAARAADLLGCAKQDGAEHTVGDDLVLLRLRHGVDRVLNLRLSRRRRGDEIPVAARVDERIPEPVENRRAGERECVGSGRPAIGRGDDRNSGAGRQSADATSVSDRQDGLARRRSAADDDPVRRGG